MLTIKRVLISSLFWSLFLVSYAQENIRIGVSISPISGQIIGPLQSLDGGASYYGNRFFGAGLDLLYPLSATLDLETGIGYTRQQVTVHSTLPPDVPTITRTSTTQVWELPALARIRFLKHFFANGGVILHVDATTNKVLDSQSGIGLQLGLGWQFAISSRASVYINTFSKMYTVLPFQAEQYQERIWLNGVKIGCLFALR